MSCVFIDPFSMDCIDSNDGCLFLQDEESKTFIEALKRKLSQKHLLSGKFSDSNKSSNAQNNCRNEEQQSHEQNHRLNNPNDGQLCFHLCLNFMLLLLLCVQFS